MSPEVSVVMSVFNGERDLPAAVEGVLAQEGVDLELLVVDDGSTDGSPQILEGYAGRDPRVRVLLQPNLGLTQALRRACAEARGRYIARHDADDLSDPRRLRLQIDALERAPEWALVTCWATLIGPSGEILGSWESTASPEELRASLRAPSVRAIRNIVHGTAVFRRSDYELAGGYRPEFRVAQDIDLWLRLTDRGAVGCVRASLYQRRITPRSISGRFAAEQVRLADIALRLTSARAVGGEEAPLLAEAGRVEARSARPAWQEEAEGFYFIGKCLLDRRDSRSRAYFREAVRRRPSAIKAWLGLCAGFLLR